MNASDVIILEGILVFHDQRVRNLMNLKIFVDTGLIFLVSFSYHGHHDYHISYPASFICAFSMVDFNVMLLQYRMCSILTCLVVPNLCLIIIEGMFCS